MVKRITLCSLLTFLAFRCFRKQDPAKRRAIKRVIDEEKKKLGSIKLVHYYIVHHRREPNVCDPSSIEVDRKKLRNSSTIKLLVTFCRYM